MLRCLCMRMLPSGGMCVCAEIADMTLRLLSAHFFPFATKGDVAEVLSKITVGCH